MSGHNHELNPFGRREPGCPRCDDLASGEAQPKKWGPSRKQQDAERAAEIRDHDCRKANCGLVCTFGDW